MKPQHALVAGVAVNVGLWLFVPALFWFWWNVTGALACWAVAGAVSAPQAAHTAERRRPQLDWHWPSIALLAAWFGLVVGVSASLPVWLAD